MLLLLSFVGGCYSPEEVYKAIEKKYPNSIIYKLQGDAESFLIKTGSGEVRYYNANRACLDAPDVDQKIHFLSNQSFQIDREVIKRTHGN